MSEYSFQLRRKTIDPCTEVRASPIRSEQVTKKFINRGVAYLGGPAASRNRKILDELYEIRSQAVHSGSFLPGAASKLGGPDQVIAEGQQIATQLLRKMIAEGSRPQWPD